MSVPSIDIKDLLIARVAMITELALVFGTNLHIGREPEKPSNVVTIFDAPGGPPFLSYADTSGENSQYEYLAFQIRVRHLRYDKAMLIAGEISNALHNFGNTVINDHLYTLIEGLDSPFLLEWDENNRAKVAVNFAAQRTNNNEEFDT